MARTVSGQPFIGMLDDVFRSLGMETREVYDETTCDSALYVQNGGLAVRITEYYARMAWGWRPVRPWRTGPVQAEQAALWPGVPPEEPVECDEQWQADRDP